MIFNKEIEKYNALFVKVILPFVKGVAISSNIRALLNWDWSIKRGGVSSNCQPYVL